MFTPQQRDSTRSEILEYAARDPRIIGAAITGSAAAGSEDDWSDIDLAFAVAEGADLQSVLRDWTAHMYERHRAIHHMDVVSGAWIYRVFLLPGILQVDLAFVPAAEFRALAPTFRLVFGAAGEPGNFPSPAPGDLIGMGWLYALHARSCIARGKVWQAEYMISGLRDTALTLACIRHNLPAAHGRGIDRLPAPVSAEFEGALVRHLDHSELSRAFQVAVDRLMHEIRSVDADLMGRLQETLSMLCPG